MSTLSDWRSQWDVAGIEYGLCLCGCGERTTIAKGAHPNGYIKGEPVRFRHNHGHRKSRVEYREEDRGYITPCWIWQRAITGDGYGSVEGRRAHRVYYEKAVGAIPPQHELHHLCETRSCVNPAHLQALTRSEHLRLRADTRLDVASVRDIKVALRDRTAGVWSTSRDLAKRFEVSPSTIVAIHYGYTWRDVQVLG